MSIEPSSIPRTIYVFIDGFWWKICFSYMARLKFIELGQFTCILFAIFQQIHSETESTEKNIHSNWEEERMFVESNVKTLNASH